MARFVGKFVANLGKILGEGDAIGVGSRGARTRRLCLALCLATLPACSNDDGRPEDPNPGGGNTGASGASGAGGGGAGAVPSGSFAEQIPLSDTFAEVDGAIAPTDLPFVENFCGDPAVPSSLKPLGTVVRARVSFRYFVCTGDLGMNSYDGIQTNEPGDPTQGFIPYAALFRYDDAAKPNLQQPAKGAANYGLIVVNVLGTTANSSCRGSNGTFESFKIGGALAQACNGVPSPVRDANKYVDVTFPGGQMQSFLLEPVPFEPPP